MVISIFSVSNKDSRETFFKESLIWANVKPNVDFGMLFLSMNNDNIDFQAQNLYVEGGSV